MSDEHFLNDPELQQIEHLLGGLTLGPSDTERSKILLACGRAEGHADAQRTIRQLRGGMLVFAGAAVCLLAVLLHRRFVPVANDVEGTRPIAENQSPDAAPDTPGFEKPVYDHSRIKMFGVMTPRSEWDWESRPNPSNPSPDTIELVSQQETLTTRSRTVLNELLN